MTGYGLTHFHSFDRPFHSIHNNCPHAWIQWGGGGGVGGPDPPPPPKKPQKYRVSQQHWSGSPEKSQSLQYWAIIGPPAKRHLNVVSLAGRWWPTIECWLGSFVVLQGIRTSIAKEPFIFVIFHGGPDPISPSGSAHDILSLVTENNPS